MKINKLNFKNVENIYLYDNNIYIIPFNNYVIFADYEKINISEKDKILFNKKTININYINNDLLNDILFNLTNYDNKNITYINSNFIKIYFKDFINKPDIFNIEDKRFIQISNIDKIKNPKIIKTIKNFNYTICNIENIEINFYNIIHFLYKQLNNLKNIHQIPFITLTSTNIPQFILHLNNLYIWFPVISIQHIDIGVSIDNDIVDIYNGNSLIEDYNQFILKENKKWNMLNKITNHLLLLKNKENKLK